MAGTIGDYAALVVPADSDIQDVNGLIEAFNADQAGVAVGGELYSDAMGGAGTAGESYVGMMRENILTIVKGLQ